MTDFNAILLEGVFYTSEELYPDSKGATREGFCDLLAKPDQGPPRSVYRTLEPFIGERIHFAAHQLPDHPPNPHRWGGGSCLWESSGHCPFGHHEKPYFLYNVSGEGILEYDLDLEASSGGWWLLRPDGTREMLPLVLALVGHRARVATATAMTVEQMRDSVLASGDLDSVEAIEAKVADLRELLKGLGQAVKGD